MKRLLLFAVFFAVMLPAVFAQGTRSILKVRVSDNSPIMIQVDKRIYKEQNHLLTIDNLPAGRHYIKVFLAAKNGNRNSSIMYAGYLQIKPATTNYVIVDRHNRTIKLTTNKIETDRFDDRDGRHPNDPIDRSKYSTVEIRNKKQGVDFSQREMDDLKMTVLKITTDTKKMEFLQNSLKGKSYSTQQVGTMISWLNFESSKLDFAKWAYTNVADSRNYGTLQNLFEYSSTREEFNNFLSRKK